MRLIGLVAAFVVLLGTALPAVAGTENNKACWGQASAVFAQMGEMGEHSSSQATPRIGLANLARILYEQGILDAPSLQELGEFVVSQLGLDVDACQ